MPTLDDDCPLCGGPAHSYQSDFSDEFFVACKDDQCGVCTRGHKTEAEAWAQWNVGEAS